MTVKELIEILKTMPQDVPVIRTYHSDFDFLLPEHVTLMEPKDGEGIIRRHDHLMKLRKGWWPHPIGPEKRPTDPEFLTCVHIDGN